MIHTTPWKSGSIWKCGKWGRFVPSCRSTSACLCKLRRCPRLSSLVSVLRASALSEEGLGTWLFLASSSGCLQRDHWFPICLPGDPWAAPRVISDSWSRGDCTSAANPFQEGNFSLESTNFSDNPEKPSTSSTPALGAGRS